MEDCIEKLCTLHQKVSIRLLHCLATRKKQALGLCYMPYMLQIKELTESLCKVLMRIFWCCFFTIIHWIPDFGQCIKSHSGTKIFTIFVYLVSQLAQLVERAHDRQYEGTVLARFSLTEVVGGKPIGQCGQLVFVSYPVLLKVQRQLLLERLRLILRSPELLNDQGSGDLRSSG